MPNLISKLILCKGINIDNEYKNVLSYSESQMVTLCLNNAIATSNNCQFLRSNMSIFTDFSYGQCIQANYIAFQNPDYSNKWFFAFIDDVIYQGEKNTEIKFTVDSWSTWFDYWTKKPCYVIRQHVNDDTIGANTVPENVDTGKFVINNSSKYNMGDIVYIIQVTQWTTGSNPPLATNYGGVWYTGGAYVCPDLTTAVTILTAFGNNVKDIVYGFYMCPKSVISLDANYPTQGIQWGGQNSPEYHQKIITKPTTIDGYTPKNNKLLTGQFCFLNVSNNNGRINSYYYELFNEVDEYPNKCIFNISGVPTVGCSIKCSPNNYKQNNEEDNEDEGIIAGKFPTLSWSDNAYINWLTQNSVNISQGVVKGGLLLAGGILAENLLAVGSSSASLMSEIFQSGQIEEPTPNNARGNTNGGDINTCTGTNTFYFQQMSVTRQFAKKVDDYFSRYGYKILEIASPNITGRTYWNYIEIGKSEDIGTGDVPTKYMDEINNACRKGVTIWHNHANVGNFGLNNTIVT